MLHGKQACAWWAAGGSIHVDYGIEKYFVAEDTGNPTGDLTVQVVLSTSGRATRKSMQRTMEA